MKGYIKKIEQINFGLMSPEDIRAMSVVTVETPDTYEDDGFPIEKGLMDPRLGVIDPSLVCRTCGFRGGDCQGHFGSIELARPVIHIGFGDIIHKILRSTCNECGRVLLDDQQIEEFTERINGAMHSRESLNAILKEVYRVTKRELKTMPEDDEEIDPKHCCPHCGTPQEAIHLDMPVTIRQGDYKLTPSEVRERLEKINDEDSFVLGVNPEVARPEWLVLTVLPVPPVTVRPSITLDTGERSEDDLTHKLVDILRINQRLLENMEAGAPQLIVEDLWELLQYHVTTYFDNEASGVPPARHRSGRPLKTLTQRLKGKEGRFRSNLSGKRVNFSARTVISPDPNISINEVGVPEMIAKEVTVPVYVNKWNIDEMRTYIENGPDVHPGANYVIRRDGRKIRVRNEETKELILEQLEPGFVIERHLKDGDMVLFNRQPSLHRMSMMAHEVRVLPYKTFRLNLCVCPPYNADFDGDEMNMHVFQTVESRAEAKSLMRVQEHILSPRFGGPIIGAIHDHISGAYLLTRDGFSLTEEEAFQFIRKSHLKLPELKNNIWVLKEDPEYGEESYIFKEKGEKWTGKELFSLLLPNDMNLSYGAEISKCPVVYPAEDAKVVIKDGILVQGVIDESAYGSFSGKILDKIVKEYGPGRAKEFLDRSTDLAICAIMKTGITISLNDAEIPGEVQDRINEHLDNKMVEVDKLVESYEEGYLQALPGRSLEETLEMKIMQVLGEARDMSRSIAENYLTMGKQSDDDPYDHVMAVENHSVVMARTGARASMLNLTQITACVGQQAVRGGRIERGYLNRTLPHFKKGELGAKAKGFVHSSYKSGLDPIEFFFHAMGGREGLVDTAIRTAQSGYMQRRLVNALQDLQVKSSGLVTDNQGNVIQTMFGEDGVDPAKSDFGKPADLNKLIDEIRLGHNKKSHSSHYVSQTKFKNERDDDIKTIEEQSEISNLNERRNELYNLAYNRIKNLNDDYLNNEAVLKDLKSDVTESQGLLFDKNTMLENIKSIENEIAKYLDILLGYKNKIIKYDSIESSSIEEINNAISKINEVFDDFRSRDWPNFETKLNDLQEMYESRLNDEKSLNTSEDSEQLISEFNKTFNNPFIFQDLRKFNLTQEQLQLIKKIIIEDIVNKKIVGTNLNFKLILISYCEEFTKDSNTLTDEELDEILSNVDLSNIDESIVNECKSKVKKDYESNEITKNQIPIKFNKHRDKKLHEIKNLEELEKIKNNPYLPKIKQNLSSEECILIYDNIKKKICGEYGLREDVLSFVENLMYRKNEENKSEAREEFKNYRYDKKYFLNLTGLENNQYESFVKYVELLIDDNEIKTNHFNEEFIKDLSLKFINNGNKL